jgi:hypothetical protein
VGVLGAGSAPCDVAAEAAPPSVLNILAGIARGRAAWSTLKASAEEQRTLWLEVGVALMYGKVKENRTVGQKFSDWVRGMFPGLGEHDARAAIWFAEKSSDSLEIPAGMTNPQSIRQWHGEQAQAQALPQELHDIAPVATAPVMDKRQAEKASKVINRMKAGGPTMCEKHV